MKSKRQEKILELIDRFEIETQEELTDHLRAIGYSTTQVTVSRDIKELRLIKSLSKTLPGLADAAGAAIDAMKLPDMLGCISGNDAVAIVARGEQEAERLCYDLRQYCK